jgi:hypothetical protein
VKVRARVRRLERSIDGLARLVEAMQRSNSIRIEYGDAFSDAPTIRDAAASQIVADALGDDDE